MGCCYSAPMANRHPSTSPKLPDIWLVTDARNDAALGRALKRLPRGSGIVYRHYHLPPAERRARFETVKRAAHARGHLVVLSGSAREARNWGADGAYGPPRRLGPGPAALRLVTAHSLREISKARNARAAAIVLSPVFPTRSHPDASALGAVRFLLLARRSPLPVVALGGMDRHYANRLRWRKWAAIDGLSR